MEASSVKSIRSTILQQIQATKQTSANIALIIFTMLILRHIIKAFYTKNRRNALSNLQREVKIRNQKIRYNEYSRIL